jgi:hypothetical protein
MNFNAVANIPSIVTTTLLFPSILFIYGTRNQIEEERQKQAEIKNDKKWHLLNFIMNHENKMITVPNKQMEDFIRISNLPVEEIILDRKLLEWKTVVVRD